MRCTSRGTVISEQDSDDEAQSGTGIVRFIFESPEGRKTTVDADGVRLPFDRDTWGQIDFEEGGGTFRVMIGGRSKEGHPCPRLGIQPLAANSILIEFLEVVPKASGPQVVIPVSKTELDVDPNQLYSGTTSGDPVGEVLLGRASKERYSEPVILLPIDGLGVLRLSHFQGDLGQPMIKMTVELESFPKVGVPFRAVAVSFGIHAANLISISLKWANGSMRVE